MKKFNVNSECPKCNNNDDICICFEKDRWGNESIGRRCCRCGYKWKEACLDSKQELTNEQEQKNEQT